MKKEDYVPGIIINYTTGYYPNVIYYISKIHINSVLYFIYVYESDTCINSSLSLNRFINENDVLLTNIFV